MGNPVKGSAIIAQHDSPGKQILHAFPSREIAIETFSFRKSSLFTQIQKISQDLRTPELRFFDTGIRKTVMGFRLKITLKSEKKFVLLATQPQIHWCERCRAESRFVDEDEGARVLRQLAADTSRAHRSTIGGRTLLCLKSISDET